MAAMYAHVFAHARNDVGFLSNRGEFHFGCKLWENRSAGKEGTRWRTWTGRKSGYRMCAGS